MPTLSSPVAKTIFDSAPGTPKGYSSWVGADLNPTGLLHVGFVVVTGDPAVNPKVGDPTWEGVTIQRRVLRSSDHGVNWTDAVKVPPSVGSPHPWSMQAMGFSPVGVLVTRVNNEDLYKDFSTGRPGTAYLERWSAGAFAFLAYPGDPAKKIVQITRLQRLRTLLNGAKVMLGSGNQWQVPAGQDRSKAPFDWFLGMSIDGGKTWRDALTNPRQVDAPANEWSVCELADGNLLAVMRTKTGTTQVRKQAILKRNADGTYTFGPIQASPFPHSGHPEVISPDSGKTAIHFATTGVHWTQDQGKSWHIAPGKTAYYPRGVVDGDTLRVFGHVGADDDYRERDQTITMTSWKYIP